MPGPHSATFRYSSRIRSFESVSSSRRAVTASFTLRIGLREEERYRFLATCWVIVLAPRRRSRCRHAAPTARSEEHTSELQSRLHLVCRLLLEKKKKKNSTTNTVSESE